MIPRTPRAPLKLFLLVCATLLFVSLVFYSDGSQREGGYALNASKAPSFTWYANSTRDVAIYVQPENVTAIIPNEDFCQSSANSSQKGKPLLLIVVCSAVGNFRARETLRKTWMSVDQNQTAPFVLRTVFLLGQTVNDTWQNEIRAESSLHGDIVQEGFIDAYLNLTLKSVMMLKWVKTYCPQVTFLLKTDDDMFVNVPALVDYLNKQEIRERKDLIAGALFCRVVPIKDHGNKWYSPQFMFDGKEYPDYVSGTGYVISGALVPSLFESALLVPLFHLEDVFVTGMVARRSNVVPENFHLFSFVKHPTDNACLYRKIITSHGLSPEEQMKVWSHVRNRSINCTTVQLPKIGDVKLKKCRKVKKVAAASAAAHRGFRRG